MTGISTTEIVGTGISSATNTGVVNQEALQQKEYIAILEKTNQQLSVWGNPYGIMVGGLSILMTFLAIGVAIYIYKQSRDYKDNLLKQQKETNENYNKNLNLFLEGQDKIIKEKTEKYEALGQEMEAVITKYEQQLGDTTSKGKEEIEKALSELRKEKEKILSEMYIPTVNLEPVDYLGASSLDHFQTSKKIIKCTNCGRSFYVKSEDPFSLYSGRVSSIFCLNNQDAICPYCGTKCYVG